MASSRPSPFLTFLLALAVLAAAGAVRFWALSSLAEAGKEAAWQVQSAAAVLGADGKSDQAVLLENLKTRGFVHGFRSHAPLTGQEEDTAHAAPGYPAFRALVEGLAAPQIGFGDSPAQLTRWTQAALGSLTALFVFLAATRAFQSRVVGLLAGAAAIFHPFWVISTPELQDGVLATFLVSFALCLAIRAGQQGGALTCLVLGMALSAAALTRAALLPFAVAMLLWYLWRSRVQANGWLFALVAFFGFLLGMALWGVRCHQQLGAPAPIVTSAWWHLWVGNNPNATGGPASKEMEAALPADRKEALAKEPQATRYKLLARDVLEEVENRPQQTLARRAKALLLFFFGATEPKRTNLLGHAEANKPDEWIFNSLACTLMGMFLLAALGWRWSYGWKSSTAPLAIAMIWIPLPYILAHAEPLHGPRLPLDAALIILAAMAFSCFLPFVGSRLFRGEAAQSA